MQNVEMQHRQIKAAALHCLRQRLQLALLHFMYAFIQVL